MLCIISFFVFALLSIFSASHRPLAKKAWYCLVKKIQFKPCDINFNEELKGKMLGKMIFTHPRLGAFLYKWIDVLSIVFVIVSVWSLLAVVRSSVYLLAYDTCDPYSQEGCSLAGDSCTINVASLTFVESFRTGTTMDWLTLRVTTFGEAITRIPNRFKRWDPQNYLPANPSYYSPFDANKPLALEVIDPSCQFCAELFNNIKESQAYERHNLTYIAYPIPSGEGQRFPHSWLIATYLEAVKQVPLTGSSIPTDWQLLERVFAHQESFNLVYDRDQAMATIHGYLGEIGYTPEQIGAISTLAQSVDIAQILEANARIVEDQIQTIKIPTIMIGGRRFDRLIDADRLRNM